MPKTRPLQSWNKKTAYLLASLYSVALIVQLVFFPEAKALLRFWTVWFAGALAWLNYPLSLGSVWWSARKEASQLIDYAIGLGFVLAGLGLLSVGLDTPSGAGAMQAWHVVAGTLGIFILLEFLRRAWGESLVVVAIVAMLVAWLGISVSGSLTYEGMAWSKVVWLLWYSTDGAFGRWTEVMAYSALVVVLLGALIENLSTNSGVASLSDSLTSHFRGSPVLSSILSSAWFGMMNESVTSNVAGTGVRSIPDMQKAGAEPAFAAATESAASTGGQLIPPVMTVAAFAMADALQVSYIAVAVAALIPALLYYFVVMQTAHGVACRDGLDKRIAKPLSPADWGAVAIFFIPVALMAIALVSGASVAMAGLLSIATVLLLARLAGSEAREHIGSTRVAVMQGGLSGSELMLSVAATGMVYAVLKSTGLAEQLTALITTTVGLHPVPLLITSMLVVVALGTSLPTFASYLFASMVFVPALEQSGIHVFVAHMFILYYAVLAHMVPPVAPACEAAAPIAEVSTNEVNQAASKYVMLALFVPLIFTMHPSLLLGVGDGSLGGFVLSTIQAVLALSMISSAVTGGGLHRGYLSNQNRLIRLIAAACLLADSAPVGLFGFALMLFALLLAARDADDASV